MTAAISGEKVTIDHDRYGVAIHFHETRMVLSSCILNGGVVSAQRIVNRKVAAEGEGHRLRAGDPEATLMQYHRHRGWKGLTVGMMTAASMESFRHAAAGERGLEVRTMVTTGLSNAKRAGEAAEIRETAAGPLEAGTINIVTLVNRPMSPETMVEAVMIVTEAKTVALADIGVRSTVSDNIATGTGTDAIAVVCGNRGPMIRYCGKHLLAGELLARTTIQALSRSLAWYLGPGA